MAYNIYGGILERGHCEVHIDVAETYPCRYCLAEGRQNAAMEREYDEYCNAMLAQQYDDYEEDMRRLNEGGIRAARVHLGRRTVN